MRISEIAAAYNFPLPAWNGLQVETKTDAIQNISTIDALDMYIAEYGDVEIEDENASPMRVPAHRDAVDTYTAAKIKDCARWGCN